MSKLQAASMPALSHGMITKVLQQLLLQPALIDRVNFEHMAFPMHAIQPTDFYVETMKPSEIAVRIEARLTQTILESEVPPAWQHVLPQEPGHEMQKALSALANLKPGQEIVAYKDADDELHVSVSE